MSLNEAPGTGLVLSSLPCSAPSLSESEGHDSTAPSLSHHMSSLYSVELPSRCSIHANGSFKLEASSHKLSRFLQCLLLGLVNEKHRQKTRERAENKS